MRKTAVFCLVVVVLLAGMTLPGAALQGGPPDHAEGEGDGPPDHANDGGNGGDSGDGDDADAGDDGDSDDEEETADDDGDATDPPDADDATDAADATDTAEATDAAEATDTVDAVDTGDATGDDDSESEPDDGPTPTATPESDDSDESLTDTVEELLPTDDEDDDQQGETSEDEPQGTETSHESEDPLPVPDDDDETETPPDSERTPSGDDGSDNRASDEGDDDEEPTVEVGTDDSATVVDVTGVEDGDVVEADLRGPATEGEHVALEAVEVRVDEDGPFTLTATRPTGETNGAAAPGVPVSYFEVETDAAVEEARLTVEVDEAALPEGVEPADVEVLRQTDDGWETTETTYHEDEGVYTAETSGLSTFAVAAPSEGPIEVTDAEVSDNGGSGEAATAVATVENTGDREATRTIAATVDGETVATRELTLEGGESATVTFEVPADRAEDSTVAVDGVEAGQLQVAETGGDGSPASSSSRNLAFGVGAAIFVVLSAVGTGLLAARHEDWDWEL